jgi:ferredoxin
MADRKVYKKGLKRNRAIRLGILVIILIAATFGGIQHQIGKTWVPPGVDAFCPFGGIEGAVYLITNGRLIEKIAWSSFILLFAVILVAIIFRRAFCGTLCPMGTIQELFARLGRLIFKKPLRIPGIIDKPARYLKYLVLVVFIVLTIILGRLAIRPYDPWATYHHLISADLFSEFPIGFVVLVITIIGSFLFDRFFCKYVCPMGAFLGLINRIGLFRVKRNESSCIHCKACDKACPVQIPVESEKEVHSSECINCQECVNVCPEKGTLEIRGPRGWKFSPLAVSLISLGIFVLVVGITSFTGDFEWKLKTLEETASESGMFNPDDIKGRDTFRQVAELTGIEKDLFMEEFPLTDEEFDAPIKDAAHKEDSGFETEDVREFVRKQLE